MNIKRTSQRLKCTTLDGMFSYRFAFLKALNKVYESDCSKVDDEHQSFNTIFTYSKGSEWILQEFAHLFHEKHTKGTSVTDSCGMGEYLHVFIYILSVDL